MSQPQPSNADRLRARIINELTQSNQKVDNFLKYDANLIKLYADFEVLKKQRQVFETLRKIWGDALSRPFSSSQLDAFSNTVRNLDVRHRALQETKKGASEGLIEVGSELSKQGVSDVDKKKLLRKKENLNRSLKATDRAMQELLDINQLLKNMKGGTQS